VRRSSLEHQLVEKTSTYPTKDRTSPVHPVVVPAPHHQAGPQAACWVHDGAGEGDGEEVAGGDGKAYDKRSRAFHINLCYWHQMLKQR